MRMRTSKLLLLFGAIAIVMLVSTTADARRRGSQGEETIADATAVGAKAYGFLHISITNLEQEYAPPFPYPTGLLTAVYGEVTTTLRLRAKGETVVFQTKIPRSLLGLGAAGSGSINDFELRDLILGSFSGDTGRVGGIVADVFYPGDGFEMTLKVLDEDLGCVAATETVPVVGCPVGPDPGPNPGDPPDLRPVVKVADVTIAFTTMP
jgi:hypothetical protein